MTARMAVAPQGASFGIIDARRRAQGGVWRWTLGAVAAAAVGVAVLPWLSLMAGYRPLVVQSGSMAPAVRTGDAMLSRVVHPAAVGVGDVVTFVDETRGGRLVTHRVIEVRHHDDRYSFVTKGDRSVGVERWDIDERDTLGRMALRVPKLGFAVAATSSAQWRALCGALVMCLVTVPMIRRIWS